MTGPQKRPFLAVYDYGQGGVWVLLLAKSADEIATKYPELQIVDHAPPSISEEELEDIKARRTVDIDDASDQFLASLRENRSK
jgi:hypothetical protein